MLARSEVISQKKNVARPGQAIIRGENILSKKVIREVPTRTVLRIIGYRAVACDPIRSKGTGGSKGSPELIRVERQIRGKSLTHGQERTADKQAFPYVGLDSFMGRQERTAPAVAFQQVAGRIFCAHRRGVGKSAGEIQSENNSRAKGITKAHCEA